MCPAKRLLSHPLLLLHRASHGVTVESTAMLPQLSGLTHVVK